MSRIAKKPIQIPAKTDVSYASGVLTVKGSLGEIKKDLRPEIKVEVVNNEIILTPIRQSLDILALWGTYASHIRNMLEGVNKAYEKKLIVEGIGTTLGAINFIMTILKMRVKGMTLWKMPAFTWGSLCSMLMAATIFPILTMTLFLVFFDRYLGTHFFTTTAGGNAMLYSNLIWMWGHPEVYVLILPAYAIFSEIVAVFSRKPVANYKSNVFGLIGVASLSLVVWLHHFFTMGSSADVNAFFGIMTVFVAIPTTVLVFNWIATMYKGRIRLDTPMLWFLGFAGVFAIGGITGVLLAVPSIDFQLHNSLFLVAHFHSTVIGGVVFGVFAGISYWFPKFTGFRLNERLGRYAFWLWIVGYFMSFVPMFILGLMGASRRLDHYDASTGWQPFFIVSLIGGIVITAGVIMQVVQIIASFIEKKRLMDTTGDPWDARTLEWSVASPAPAYNFAALPDVSERDGFWAMKQAGLQKPTYEDIHMPKNTASGIYLSIYAFLTGFGFVWDIKWLIIVGIVGMIYTFITRTFDEDSEYKIAASDVEKSEQEHFAKMQEVEKSRDQSKIGPEYDMGLSDFIKIVWKWLLGLARHKK
jgi:cytochrome o ubiquinol oxidase subunit 1